MKISILIVFWSFIYLDYENQMISKDHLDILLSCYSWTNLTHHLSRGKGTPPSPNWWSRRNNPPRSPTTTAADSPSPWVYSASLHIISASISPMSPPSPKPPELMYYPFYIGLRFDCWHLDHVGADYWTFPGGRYLWFRNHSPTHEVHHPKVLIKSIQATCRIG